MGKSSISIFLCGDVMTGRGIDQILPHPGDPVLHEDWVRDARRYRDLAEEAGGPIEAPVDFSYIWGQALGELERVQPDLRIINLETSVTSCSDYWRGKGINYRMHPRNIDCLTAARIDACALANNHLLDWGYEGLAETLMTLKKAGIKCAGAGLDLQEAERPTILDVAGKGRVLLFSFGSETSGIPASWAATGERAGVARLHDLSEKTALLVGDGIRRVKTPGDIAVVSIHWGGNWGYEIPPEQRRFARLLIEEGGADIIHGHSSHHFKGIEVHEKKAILYGCGDFINDYEGIGGFESFRAELGLMYFPSIVAATGALVELRMIPTRIEKFRVNLASEEEARWLKKVLNREGKKLGTEVEEEGGDLLLRWR